MKHQDRNKLLYFEQFFFFSGLFDVACVQYKLIEGPDVWRMDPASLLYSLVMNELLMEPGQKFKRWIS